MWCTGSVASQHVGSSRTRARARAPPALAGGFLATVPPGKSLKIFLMWMIFKGFTQFVTILLLFVMFWLFGCETCGILAPQPGIESAPPALEGKVLTTGPPGKSLTMAIFNNHLIKFLKIKQLACKQVPAGTPLSLEMFNEAPRVSLPEAQGKGEG